MLLLLAHFLPRSDMTTMIWDSSLEDSVVAKYEDHTEFVLGQLAKQQHGAGGSCHDD